MELAKRRKSFVSDHFSRQIFTHEPGKQLYFLEKNYLIKTMMIYYMDLRLINSKYYIHLNYKCAKLFSESKSFAQSRQYPVQSYNHKGQIDH